MMIRIAKNNLHRATNIYEQEEEKEKKLLEITVIPHFGGKFKFNFPNPSCPKGHVRLTEEERVGIVGAMQERRQKLINETNRMSVRNIRTLFCATW